MSTDNTSSPAFVTTSFTDSAKASSTPPSIHRKKDDTIRSTEELLAIFLKSANAFCITAFCSNEFTFNKEDLNTPLKDLLDKLKEDARSIPGKKGSELVELLRDNQDLYLIKMEKELQKFYNKVELNNPNIDKDNISLAFKQLCAGSHIGLMEKKVDEIIKSSDKSTVWSIAADFFEKIGVTPLAKFCKKQHEETIIQFTLKSAANPLILGLTEAVKKELDCIKGNLISSNIQTDSGAPAKSPRISSYNSK